MYERILVPLDGSEVAEAALPFAERIPSRHVRLVFVEPANGSIEHDPVSVARLRLAQEEHLPVARAYLERQARGLRRQGRDIELVVEVGDPGEQIIAAASDTDLIVIGTRGQEVAGQTQGTSIADHVLRNAGVPTLLVRGALAQPAPMVVRIVVPLDGSPIAETALPAAAWLSRLLGVRPHLVRVVPVSRSASETEAMRITAASYLDEQAMRLASVDLFATRAVLLGPVAATLLAGVLPTDLVVMTAYGAGGEQRAPLGGVATRLVAEADGPVLLLHPNHLQAAVPRAAERAHLRERLGAAPGAGQLRVDTSSRAVSPDRAGGAMGREV